MNLVLLPEHAPPERNQQRRWHECYQGKEHEEAL
jgi:hypothetical protein